MIKQVGLAVIRHGCVLAALHPTPAGTGPVWTLPNGALLDAESPEAALERVGRAQVGCEVTVVGWLHDEGSRPVALARVAADAVPAPTEHSQLRWITPEELPELDWLEQDVPILVALQAALLEGDALAPGSEVVRIGETVRRPVGPLTSAVHALLQHLDRSFVEGIPQVRGIDARGREILDHVPGAPVRDLHDDQLVAMVRMLDEINASAVGFSHVSLPNIGLFSHDDFGPRWVHFADPDSRQVVGVTGWHRCAITHPARQLAHLAWDAVPLDTATPDDAVVARLDLIAEAYGGPSAREVLASVADRVREAMLDQSAADRAVTETALARFEARRDVLDRRLAALEDQVS